MSDESKKESDEKFIERSMYSGKGDKSPLKPLIINSLIAVFTFGFGIYYYLELLRWEKEGGTIKMNRLISLLYDIGGSITILIFFIAISIFLVYTGYNSYKNKKGE